MEDARASGSSQRLAITFETLIESPKADITAIAVRPESLPTGSSRDIPVSVQELVYGSKKARVKTSAKFLNRHHELISSSEEVHGPEKTEELLKGWTLMSCKGRLKNQRMLSEDKMKLAQGNDNTPVEAPKASTSKGPPQPVPKKPKKAPKTNQKGKQKAKPKWNKPYPQNYRIPKKEKTAMDNAFNMARTLMELQNRKEERLNQSFPKK
ncbi:hypothetical protein O181_116767 [Austropuccinia psidii MF-1]|uniref:Uncharacterized protein n=1 Tax=Austropuccinia psidii MF-1 TaxID=1389203 RepID=A0A9Q3KC22_9BASI|nr:hypothetical protein [Austropuccinia psidii MF-1]